MGDLLAGNGDSKVPAPSGKRVARHAAEQALTSPYTGRRVAHPAPAPEPTPEPAAPPAPYVGRRVARPEPATPTPPAAPTARVEPVPAPVEPVPVPVAPAPVLPLVEATAPEPPVPAPVEPVPVPVALAPVLPLVEATAPEPPVPAPVEPVPVPVALAPVLPLVEATAPEPPVPVAALPVPVAAPSAPTLVLEPLLPAPTPSAGKRVATQPGSPVGRRVAPRRSFVSRLPGVPLVAGLAILAVSAGGALQAMNPANAGAADAGRLVAANALSGSSGIASASLLGGRSTVVSRSGNRASSDSLQAAADAQAQQRDQALSAFAAKAEKRATQIKLHAWVLPVAPGTYQLTARFGEYSALWAHFHTGLDFAAPTGTPIMAVAGGTITEVGYSGAFGNRTIETLPDGTELWYCHQNAFGTTVGAQVKPGQVIGYIGSTGNVTGPHLHLEVHPGGGDAVDPYAALVAHGLYPGPPS